MNAMGEERIPVRRRPTRSSEGGSLAGATEALARPARAVRSLASEAYAILKGRIIRCEIAPGERLTEAGLVRELGLGKTRSGRPSFA